MHLTQQLVWVQTPNFRAFVYEILFKGLKYTEFENTSATQRLCSVITVVPAPAICSLTQSIKVFPKCRLYTHISTFRGHFDPSRLPINNTAPDQPVNCKTQSRRQLAQMNRHFQNRLCSENGRFVVQKHPTLAFVWEFFQQLLKS